MTECPEHSSLLIDLPEAALWTSRTWEDFAAMPAARRRRTPVLLPVFGLADWGLGRPLDLEETLGCEVLRRALAEPRGRGPEPIVLPPLRFALAPYPHTFFGVDFETALDLLGDIAASVRAAGLGRLVLFATSPWNEELIAVAGRDARARLGLQVFLIALGALGLDLHPIRSGNRRPVQDAACACFGVPPAAAGAREAIAMPGFRPGAVRQPGPVPLEGTLAEAMRFGEGHLAEAGARLAALLAEIGVSQSRATGGPTPQSRPARGKTGRKNR